MNFYRFHLLIILSRLMNDKFRLNIIFIKNIRHSIDVREFVNFSRRHLKIICI